jgi:hypothetical protein
MRPWKWIWEGENWLVVGLRAAAVGGPAYIGWRIVSTSWKLLGIAVLVVIVKALRAATKAVKGGEKPAPKAVAEVPEKAPETGLPEVPREAFLALIRDVLGKAPGVHLATLATALVHRAGGAWEVADIRALCTTHGIGVRPKVRDLGGERVSAGIHRDDLPSPEPLPEGVRVAAVADYAAGQGGNATELRPDYATAPAPTDRRVGELRIVAVDDPDNPARTHVTVLDAHRKRA